MNNGLLEMSEEEMCNYIAWLENICVTLLVNDESTKEIIDELEKLDVDPYFADFLSERYNKMKEKNKIIQNFPLLKTYPTDILEYTTEEDEQKIQKWEVNVVKNLLWELFEKYSNNNVSCEIYNNFFIEKIEPYREWFVLTDVYEKLLPKNVMKYMSYRIDKSIDWCDCSSDNIKISIDSMVEGSYLDPDKAMCSFNHLIGND